MERLFRMGYEAALTLGNAKTIDILTCHPRNTTLLCISVKSVRGGGKWAVGSDDLSERKELVFVFLLYKAFDILTTNPEVWVVPATKVQEMKEMWLGNAYALYYSGRHRMNDLSKFKGWHFFINRIQ